MQFAHRYRLLGHVVAWRKKENNLYIFSDGRRQHLIKKKKRKRKIIYPSMKQNIVKTRKGNISGIEWLLYGLRI